MHPTSSENQPAIESEHRSSKVIWLIAIVFLVVAVLGGIWKSKSDASHELIQNRNLAHKYCVLGAPLDSDFTKNVDLELLKNDPLAEDVLELYQNKKAANEAIVLGKSTAESLKDVDLELLKADSKAGNSRAELQLNLIKTRKHLLDGVQLGKSMGVHIPRRANLTLMKDDAAAGNLEVETALKLLENRKLSEKLCVLGKPFKIEFYEIVDRDLLELDATAGYEKAGEILKLADNRVKCAELTITGIPYHRDFFDHVDKELLIKDADAGNPDSQYTWARLNEQGVVMETNNKVALKYYTLAAGQNHPASQNNLARFYAEGVIVKRNDKREFELYKKAANANYPLAIYNLAQIYREGSQVPRNIKKYIELTNKSAEMNCANAQYKLGHHYANGAYGLKKDLKKAEAYYRLAADQLDHNALVNLSRFIERTKPRKIAEKEVLEILHAAAMKGHTHSMAWYGRRKIRGQGGDQDLVEGIKWIKKSAEANNIVGMQALADMYRQGKGVEMNFPEAVRLHKLLAERGDAISMNNLGSIYSNGKPGVEKDLAQAIKYWQMSVDQGYTMNVVDLARLYIVGNGVEKNVEKALELLERGAARGDSNSFNELGNIYLNGDIVDQDTERGVAYYKKAIDLGNPVSMSNLGKHYLFGEYIAKDEAEALRLFRLGLKKNNVYCIYYIGLIHEKGLCGIKKNIPWAIKMYTRIAKKYKPAQEALMRLKKANESN